MVYDPLLDSRVGITTPLSLSKEKRSKLFENLKVPLLLRTTRSGSVRARSVYKYNANENKLLKS